MKADTNTACLIAADSPATSSCDVVVRTVAVVLVLCSFFVLSVGSASARVAHGFTSSFGEPGTGDGQLALQTFDSEARRAGSGIAVDSKDGLIFVADTGNRRVDVFTTAGAFVRAFGADVGGPGVGVCTTACSVGSGGAAAGELAKPAFVAVDESSGWVYVAEELDGWVSKFTLNGALVGSWGEGGRIDRSPEVTNGKGEVESNETQFNALDGIAVDGEGDLLVYNHFGELFRFNPAGEFIKLVAPRLSARPAGIAVRGGNVLVTYGADAVAEVTPAGATVGFFTPREAKGGLVSGLGVDHVEGGLFVDKATQVSQLASTCIPSQAVEVHSARL